MNSTYGEITAGAVDQTESLEVRQQIWRRHFWIAWRKIAGAAKAGSPPFRSLSGLPKGKMTGKERKGKERSVTGRVVDRAKYILKDEPKCPILL